MTTFLNVLSVLGGLAMFLYGMALMSEGLQKSAGDRLRTFMAKMTSNAFISESLPRRQKATACFQSFGFCKDLFTFSGRCC